MSSLFLNILTLLAPTQSADNLFHSFTVLCENYADAVIHGYVLAATDGGESGRPHEGERGESGQERQTLGGETHGQGTVSLHSTCAFSIITV